jgi:enterobactin synthetase component D / holo-[acyl-carrier protein] synthase
LLGITPELVRQALPCPVGIGIRRRSDGTLPELDPREEALLGRNAVQSRRLMFALGRAAARDALAGLDIGPVPIGRGPGGEPLWPGGIVGAITHAGEVAIAVVGRRADYAGLGIDLEELARGPSPRVARLVCRPGEMEWVQAEPGSPRLMMLFSAKEAIFKAVYPIEGVWFGFGDAELGWRDDRGSFAARLLKSPGAGYPTVSELEVTSRVTTQYVLSTTFVPTN